MSFQPGTSSRPFTLEGKHEANLLASLIRENIGDAKSENVKINLVLDDGNFRPECGAVPGANHAIVTPVVANQTTGSHYRDSLLDVAKSVLVPESDQANKDNDDLLGLLDATE